MNIRILTPVLALSLIGGLVYWRVGRESREVQTRAETLITASDAKAVQKVFKIAGDDWLGNMVFRSRLFQEELRKRNFGVKYAMVPNYAERVKALDNGAADIILISVDSYITNGNQEHFYPGVIVAVVDQSHGADAIIGSKSFKTINDLKQAKTGAFVGDSPSEFLTKAAAMHFNLDNIKKDIPRFRVDKEEDAYNQLVNGKVDFATLWEPFASRATAKGFNKLLDTAQVRDVIIDVAVARRAWIKENPQEIQAFLACYFHALHFYLNRPNEMIELVKATASVTDVAQIQTMLKGVDMASFPINYDYWFGISGKGGARLVDGIQRITNICTASGDLKSDPLNGNPYTIISRAPLSQHSSEKFEVVTQLIATRESWRKLETKEWDAIMTNSLGALLDEPIIFKQGSSELEEETEEKILEAGTKLHHYPDYRLVISCSVSPGADSGNDKTLSLERADAIKSILVGKKGINGDRILAIGTGSDNLPTKQVNESDATWKKRCRTAKVFLVQETQ